MTSPITTYLTLPTTQNIILTNQPPVKKMALSSEAPRIPEVPIASKKSWSVPENYETEEPEFHVENQVKLYCREKPKPKRMDTWTMVKCNQCHRRFKRKEKLEEHIKNDHGTHAQTHRKDAEKFDCNQCDKKFVSNSLLKKHIRNGVNVEISE